MCLFLRHQLYDGLVLRTDMISLCYFLGNHIWKHAEVLGIVWGYGSSGRGLKSLGAYQTISTSSFYLEGKHSAGADQEPHFFSVVCCMNVGCVIGVLVIAYTGFCWGVWWPWGSLASSSSLPFPHWIMHVFSPGMGLDLDQELALYVVGGATIPTKSLLGAGSSIQSP